MADMRVDEFIASLREDGRALAGAAEQASLDASVPTCPGWLVKDLLRHVGGVHRWAAAHVARQRRTPFAQEDEQRFFAAPADDALVGWFSEGHLALVDALGTADPALDCWTFLPCRSPLQFWARRQAHETAIHRADAEAAIGRYPDWPPPFAVDGVNELLDGFFARRPQRLAADPASSIALHAVDADVAWTIMMGSGGLRVVAAELSDTTLHLAGTATQLYLLLWNRAGIEGLDVHGDVAAWELWRSRATVTWS